MAFFVGQKVVCIKRGKWSDSRSGNQCSSGPVFGGIYTIRTVETDCDGILCLRFEELVFPPEEFFAGFFEKQYWANRFRLVKDTTQQVEKLKRLTLPKRQRERA